MRWRTYLGIGALHVAGAAAVLAAPDRRAVDAAKKKAKSLQEELDSWWDDLEPRPEVITPIRVQPVDPDGPAVVDSGPHEWPLAAALAPGAMVIGLVEGHGQQDGQRAMWSWAADPRRREGSGPSSTSLPLSETGKRGLDDMTRWIGAAGKRRRAGEKKLTVFAWVVAPEPLEGTRKHAAWVARAQREVFGRIAEALEAQQREGKLVFCKVVGVGRRRRREDDEEALRVILAGPRATQLDGQDLMDKVARFRTVKEAGELFDRYVANWEAGKIENVKDMGLDGWEDGV